MNYTSQKTQSNIDVMQKHPNGQRQSNYDPIVRPIVGSRVPNQGLNPQPLNQGRPRVPNQGRNQPPRINLSLQNPSNQNWRPQDPLPPLGSNAHTEDIRKDPFPPDAHIKKTREALSGYVGGSYEYINAYFRALYLMGNKDDTKNDLKKKYRKNDSFINNIVNCVSVLRQASESDLFFPKLKNNKDNYKLALEEASIPTENTGKTNLEEASIPRMNIEAPNPEEASIPTMNIEVPNLEEGTVVYRGCSFLMRDGGKGNMLMEKPQGEIDKEKADEEYIMKGHPPKKQGLKKLDELLRVEDAKKLWEGSTIIEPGMLSTSILKEKALGHCLKNGAVLLIINVPGDKRAHIVTKKTEMRKLTTPLRKEAEIIFGPQQRIKISRVEVTSNGEYKIYVMEGTLQ